MISLVDTYSSEIKIATRRNYGSGNKYSSLILYPYYTQAEGYAD